MKLTGIIEDVFRGVTIFRGYATLHTLARLSISTSYQRRKDTKRVEAITEYLTNSSYVFFPELIFGWQLDNLDAIRQIKEEENTNSISLNNGIKIRKAKFRFKSLSIGEEPKTKVVTIEIPDSLTDQIFNRIDGNHRLSVVDMILENPEAYDSSICNQIVPFCLIIQNLSTEADKYESAYFYLINAEAKSLTTEENLKSILSANNFTNEEKKELLSINSDEIVNAISQCAEELAQRHLCVVSDFFDGCVYTLSRKICTETNSPNVENIISAFSFINDEYFIDGNLSQFSKAYIYTLVKVRVVHRDQYDNFKKWARQHSLENKEGISSATIWQMFDTMINATLKVFVAMPYFKKTNSEEPDEEVVHEYRDIYKRCFDQVLKETGKPVKLFPIMNDKGESDDMIDNIMDEIEQCDIFIADITDNNPNVLYELGRAYALQKKCIIVKADSGSKVCSDIQNMRYYTYKNNSRSTTLLEVIKENIVALI